MRLRPAPARCAAHVPAGYAGAAKARPAPAGAARACPARPAHLQQAPCPPAPCPACCSMDVERFFANCGAIACFAFLGTLVSTLAIGLLVWAAGALGLCAPFSLLETLIFGSIIRCAQRSRPARAPTVSPCGSPGTLGLVSTKLLHPGSAPLTCIDSSIPRLLRMLRPPAAQPTRCVGLLRTCFPDVGWAHALPAPAPCLHCAARLAGWCCCVAAR